MLPKFLLADNSQELPNTVFVVHNETPRFIVESDVEEFQKNQTVYWIDETPTDKLLIDRLLEEAEAFLEDELANQEDLYDEEIE